MMVRICCNFIQTKLLNTNTMRIEKFFAFFIYCISCLGLRILCQLCCLFTIIGVRAPSRLINGLTLHSTARARLGSSKSELGTFNNLQYSTNDSIFYILLLIEKCFCITFTRTQPKSNFNLLTFTP